MSKWPWLLREFATYLLTLHFFGFVFFGRRFSALWSHPAYIALIGVAFAFLVFSFFTMRVTRVQPDGSDRHQ